MFAGVVVVLTRRSRIALAVQRVVVVHPSLHACQAPILLPFHSYFIIMIDSPLVFLFRRTFVNNNWIILGSLPSLISDTLLSVVGDLVGDHHLKEFSAIH